MKNYWKTIETAPKDGTIILAIDDRKKIWTSLFLESCGYFISQEDYSQVDSLTIDIKPTHWFPIPDFISKVGLYLDNNTKKTEEECNINTEQRIKNLNKKIKFILDYGKKLEDRIENLEYSIKRNKNG